MKKFILIGGAPTTGKSTLAQNLSNELGLPWFSTDQIRMLMKIYAHRDDTGGLFLPEGYEDVETFLTHFSAQEISDMEFAQAHDVWPGIQCMIDDTYSYKNGCIIEGVNITPELIHEKLSNRPDVFPLIVIDEDTQRISDVIHTRGLFHEASKYSDKLKKKEVEWVETFINKIKVDCEKYNIPCISTEKKNSDVEKILPLIKKYFKKE